jgi:hypothetical protein
MEMKKILPEIGLDDLQSAPAKMENVKADVQDPG